jgi:DNA-binding transcriptional regulator YiaG
LLTLYPKLFLGVNAFLDTMKARDWRVVPRSKVSKVSKQKEVERLIRLREVLGLTQRELAVEFMVTHGAVGLWERGDRKIPGPVLKLMGIYEERIKEGKLRPKS